MKSWQIQQKNLRYLKNQNDEKRDARIRKSYSKILLPFEESRGKSKDFFKIWKRTICSIGDNWAKTSSLSRNLSWILSKNSFLQWRNSTQNRSETLQYFLISQLTSKMKFTRQMSWKTFAPWSDTFLDTIRTTTHVDYQKVARKIELTQVPVTVFSIRKAHLLILSFISHIASNIYRVTQSAMLKLFILKNF